MEISFHHHFEKEFAKLDPVIQDDTLARIAIFREDPHAPVLHNHALKGEYDGYRSIRVTGDFRAIYIEPEEGKVVFKYVGTHSQLYG